MENGLCHGFPIPITELVVLVHILRASIIAGWGHLERMAHWNFKFIGNKWKMAHAMVCPAITLKGCWSIFPCSWWCHSFYLHAFRGVDIFHVVSLNPWPPLNKWSLPTYYIFHIYIQVDKTIEPSSDLSLLTFHEICPNVGRSKNQQFF